MTGQFHLIIIIDDQAIIEPKKYCCLLSDKNKNEAINSAKKFYEQKYNNFNYKSYYFRHENPKTPWQNT